MRRYKKKENPKQNHTRITQDKLDTVLHHLKKKSSIRQAARNAGINEASLRYILKKNNLKDKFENVQQIPVMAVVGSPTTFPKAEESTLATVIQLRSKWGFGLSRSAVRDLVKDFIDLHKEKDTPLGHHLRKHCHFKVSFIKYFS